MTMSKIQMCLLALGASAVLTFSSCTKDKMSGAENQASIKDFQETLKPTMIDDSKEAADFAAIIAAKSGRLAAKSAITLSACKKVVHVPAQYATIQEAVEAVCDGGKVMVSEGDYTEMVYVNKPGIEIKANGVVTLNGQFLLDVDADDVTIQQFNINPPAVGSTMQQTGIFVIGVSGGQFKLNNFAGGYAAISLRNSSGITVSHNTISGSQWGITVTSSNIFPGGELSSHNLIAHNTVTGIISSSPIHLQGNSDYNVVHDNTVTLKANLNPNFVVNAAYMILENSGHTCDYNTIRNNIATDNNSSGIWVYGGQY